MGKKAKSKGKSQAVEESSAHAQNPMALQCLNATSQIASECNSILRDLLRGRSPQHQDLQRLSSQLLMSQTMILPDLRKKMESQQATLAELLKVLKPANDSSSSENDQNYSLPGASLSVVKGWESARESSSNRRRRTQKVRHDGTLTKRDRYLAIESYWRSMKQSDRYNLLSAPISKVIQAASTELGPDAQSEVIDGIKLLLTNSSRYACYWQCPCCDIKTADPRAFFRHIVTFHESVMCMADTPMMCTACGQEIVGAFYYSGSIHAPTATRCLHCSWYSQPSATPMDIPQGWSLHVPEPAHCDSDISDEDDDDDYDDDDDDYDDDDDDDYDDDDDDDDYDDDEEDEEYSSEWTEVDDEEELYDDDVDKEEEEELYDEETERALSQEDRRELNLITRNVPAKRPLLTPTPGSSEKTGAATFSAAASAAAAAAAAGNNGSDVHEPDSDDNEEDEENKDVNESDDSYKGLEEESGYGDYADIEDDSYLDPYDYQCRDLHNYDDRESVTDDSASVGFPRAEDCMDHLNADLTMPLANLLEKIRKRKSEDLIVCLIEVFVILRRIVKRGFSWPVLPRRTVEPSEREALSQRLNAMDISKMSVEQLKAELLSAASMMHRRQIHGFLSFFMPFMVDFPLPQPLTSDLVEKRLMPNYEPMCISLIDVSGVKGTFNSNLDMLLSMAPVGFMAGPLPGDKICELPDVNDSDGVLSIHVWWKEHLVLKSMQESGTDNDSYLLQYLYGNVAYNFNDEFIERQRLAVGTRTVESAIMDLYGEMAEMWRHLSAAVDRRRHIRDLRAEIRHDIYNVKSTDQFTVTLLRDQAREFSWEVGRDPVLSSAIDFEDITPAALPSLAHEYKKKVSSLTAAASSSSTALAATAAIDGTWSQRALVKLQKYYLLKDERPIRYAQSLIDRELSILRLAEMMDQNECDVVEREIQNLESTIKATQQELVELEAELARIQAEGPASHRRRDLLDKVNKEAEHRERVQELQKHVAACKERLASEESFGMECHRRREEAAANLSKDRSESIELVEFRHKLDSACHAVLAAQELDKGQNLTDEYVDARIKAVWLVVRCVADTINRLGAPTDPDSSSAGAQRYQRSLALAQSFSIELDNRIQAWGDELSKVRHQLMDLACVDMGSMVETAVLEAIRQSLEEKAAAAREAATLDLLRELEEEEAAKKAAESKKAAKKKAGKGAKKKDEETTVNNSGVSKNNNEASSSSASSSTVVATKASPPRSIDRQKQGKKSDNAHAATTNKDDEYEAALERRRLELEHQESERRRQEQELIRLAQEASLKESGDMKGSTASKSGKVVTISKSANNMAGKQGPRVVVVQRTSTQAVPPPPPRIKTSPVHVANGPSSSQQGLKGGGLPPPPPPPPGKPSSSADRPGTDPAGTTASMAADGEMRIITYFGDWICYCDRVNRLWDTCQCGQIPPCRDWVRGRCTYKGRCRFSHPPFELPDALPRPKSPIAKPGPDAMVFKQARNEAASAAANAQHQTASPVMDVIGAGGQLVGNPPPPPAAKAASDVSAATAASGSADATKSLQPLKPAPWAGMRPGSAIAAPPPTASGVFSLQPPALSSSTATTAAGGGAGAVPGSSHSLSSTATGFDLFTSTPLIQVFGAPSSSPAASVSATSASDSAVPVAGPVRPATDPSTDHHALLLAAAPMHAVQQGLPTAFGGLSLGGAGTTAQNGLPPSPGPAPRPSAVQTSPSQQQHSAAASLFHAHQDGGGFLGSSQGIPPPPVSVYHQSAASGMLGTGEFLSDFSVAGHANTTGLSILGQTPMMPQDYDDEWNDLQLQLPSDLGEMLGE